VVTNSEGRYRLLNIKPGHYNVAISFVGYARQIKPVDVPAAGKEIILNIKLLEGSYHLSEVSVRVSREDPAVSIIKHAIAKRRFYLNQVQAYRCLVYIKGIQKLRDAPKKIFGQDVKGQLETMGLDSGKRGILYLSESVSKLSVKKPDKIHEEMISSKVSGRNNSFSFNQASDLSVNFYEGHMDLRPITNKVYISPIADNALSVYKFRLTGTTGKIYRIEVIPKRKGANLFEGRVFIQDSTWNLEATDLRIAAQSKIEFLDTLAISQQFREPKPGVFVLSTEELKFSLKLLKFDIAGNYLESLTDYEFNPKFTKADFPSDILHISSASNKKDSTYWNLVRPVPLSKEEKRDYVRKDSIGIVHSGKRYLDSLDKAGNKITPGGLLLTGVTFQNRFAKSRLDIPPLGSVLSYNTVEGLAFNPAVTYHKKTSDTTSYSLSTTLRYGFVNRRFNPSASYTQVFNMLDHSILVLSGGSQMSDQNRLRGLDPLLNTYQTLFNKINALKLFEKHFAAVNYSRDITRQFNLGANFEFAGRTPLPNMAYEYITGPPNRHFTANDPYSSPGNGLAFKTNRAATLTLSARLNLGGKVYFPARYAYFPRL